jgi:uncharacterized protein (DUF2384 family)
MPRTNLQRHLTRKPDERLVAKIWGVLAARDIPVENLLRGARITRATLYRRRQHPEDFTLAEIRRIGRYLDIPVDELRQLCF